MEKMSTLVNAITRNNDVYISLKDLTLALLRSKDNFLKEGNTVAAYAIEYVLGELRRFED